VEFRLLYEGQLRPTANKKHAEETHAIRRSFHPQLKKLWKINPNLRTMAQNIGLGESQKSGPAVTLTMDEYFNLGINSIGRNWTKAGYDLVPLVTPDMALRCSLDILLLRPHENKNKYIYSQGDIDGQLKTLFDALRRPSNRNETGGSEPPSDEEKPLFCLLEDDRLISEVRVNSDELLLLSNLRELEANDAFVLIHVKLNHKDARTFGNVFG
jgi:hypothetical protein